MTRIGDTISYIFIYLIALAYSFYKRDFNLFITILTATIIALISVELFKNIFMRLRPLEFMRMSQAGYSYPSGHSTVSAATYWTFKTYLKKNGKSNKFADIFLTAMPFLIATSRVVIGVHWPSDVLMGLLLGAAISKESFKLSSLINEKLNKRAVK
ncbi:MAG: phosphatase PAP2 family protein [Tissierellia bacterium]|nr:phosphatase PAP2 family protein [Tissierellia bacterium]